MNRFWKIIQLSVISCLVSGSLAHAASLGEGIQDSRGQWMSQVAAVAGSGSFGEQNGEGLSASFRNPERVAIAQDGSLYISDTDSHLIRKYYNGKVSVLAGNTLLTENGFPAGTLLDGQGEAASFSEPGGLAVDAAGNVYVADKGNHSIRRIDPQGRVATLAGNGILGLKDGPGAEALFHSPQDVAVTSEGIVYVADTLNHVIRRVEPDGRVTTLNSGSSRYIEVTPGYAVAAGEYQDGPLQQAKFNEPSGLVLDIEGNLYVSDTGNQVIRYIDFTTGKVSTVAGYGQSSVLYAPGGYADGHATQKARFHAPKGLALTDEGGLVIADSLNHSIRYLRNGEVTTLAGSDKGEHGNRNGINGHNLLHSPQGVQVGRDGRILIADAYNNQIKTYQLYAHPDNLPDDGQIHVVLDNQWVEFDSPPEIVNDLTMVPVRTISEAIGYTVEFENGEKKITLSKDGSSISFQIGETQIWIEDAGQGAVEAVIGTAPYIKNDLTYVPLRVINEHFGLDVQWDNAKRTAIIRHKAP